MLVKFFAVSIRYHLSVRFRCGKGKRGNLVVDATDRCCQVHDNCYGSAEAAIEKCTPLLKAYKHKKMSNGTIQCIDPAETCAHRTCQCDKAAVECFLRQRKTTYNSDFDNWKGLCSETSKKLEDDPQRCPPIWNTKMKYLRGSLVSVHGIKYQALETNKPGESPTKKLTSLNLPEFKAKWKNLGSCRRTDTVNKY